MNLQSVSTGFFNVPDTPAGGPVFMTVYVAGRLEGEAQVPFRVTQLQDDGSVVELSKGNITVPTLSVGKLTLDPTRGDPLGGIVSVNLSLPFRDLLPSMTIVQRFVADESTNVQLFIPPAEFSPVGKDATRHERGSAKRRKRSRRHGSC